MAVIEAEELTYKYPNATKSAIQNVSFKIERGEFVILTGPSGCGKTTLCRCLNGLIPHFYQGKLEGEMHIVGLNIADHPIHKLALHVGLVFKTQKINYLHCLLKKTLRSG